MQTCLKEHQNSLECAIERAPMQEKNVEGIGMERKSVVNTFCGVDLTIIIHASSSKLT